MSPAPQWARGVKRRLGALRWVRRARWQLEKVHPKHRATFRQFPLPRHLEAEILRIDDDDPRDEGGYCPLRKKSAVASLVIAQDLKRAVEIGVYRGSSLFPQAAALRHTGGVAVGIDPYSMAEWKQEQGADKMKAVYGDAHESVVAEIDWEGFYREVLDKIAQYGLDENCQIIRGLSYDVADSIAPGFDLLHIDGNHDSDAVSRDIQDYLPKLKMGGFVILDDIDWEGVAPHYEKLKRTLSLIYEDHTWAILRKT